jgi:hypothetical protein
MQLCSFRLHYVRTRLVPSTFLPLQRSGCALSVVAVRLKPFCQVCEVCRNTQAQEDEGCDDDAYCNHEFPSDAGIFVDDVLSRVNGIAPELTGAGCALRNSLESDRLLPYYSAPDRKSRLPLAHAV